MIEAAYPLARKVLFSLDAEKAHHISMASLRLAEKTGLLKSNRSLPTPSQPIQLLGLNFPNRIGLAAGLDKEGNTIDALGHLGFGFIEIGTITPRPQSGNAQPRLFRLIPHEAIINRMGFNNPGIDIGVENVRKSKSFQGPIGFNIGKNKDTPNENAAADYLACLEKAYPVADYIAVNLSSPNTPGLRELQAADSSARLLETLKASQGKLAEKHGKTVPILFKVAPDLSDEEITQLAQTFLDGGLDGLIATNTTLDRKTVENHPHAQQAGGLSGRPVKEKSDQTLAAFASVFSKKIPIIGVGGISTAEDVSEKLALGADLIQVYTSFVYQGPALIKNLLTAQAHP